MDQTIEAHPELDFHPENHLFGCIAHVLDLAACEGLLVFGVVDDPDEQERSMNAMDVSNLVQTPDGSTLNLASITCGLHGLVIHGQSSPQQSETFANTVTAIRQLDKENHQVFF